MSFLLLLLTTLGTPTYLVERVAASEHGVVRLTVFRDRVAVLARRGGPGEQYVRRVSLTEVEYSVIAQMVEQWYHQLERQSAGRDALQRGATEYRLAPPHKPALVVLLPHTAVRTLAAARLERSLDELQRRLEQTPAGAEDVSSWEPRVGDRILLADGREGRVAALLPSRGGMLVQLEIGPVTQFLTVEELRRQAVKRVEL